MILDKGRSSLVIVDLQPTFLAPILNAESVLRRTEFLARCAIELGVPIFVTEQNRERMGGTQPELAALLQGKATFESKMAFSALGCASLERWLEERDQVVICGIETHICVNQTAQDLANLGREPYLCVDAISSRTQEMNEIGFGRLRHMGLELIHTEQAVYEWLGSATHPSFKAILGLVKEYSAALP